MAAEGGIAAKSILKRDFGGMPPPPPPRKIMIFKILRGASFFGMVLSLGFLITKLTLV